MARIRSIKPEFFKDEKVADLAPEDRLLFIGLWTLADRKGILEDRPRWIRAELFPYNPGFDIDTALHALARARMCTRYTADDGSELIHITNFSEHQRPNSREPESKRPLPREDQIKAVACALACSSTSTHAHAQEEGKGNGGKAGKGKGREKDLCPLGQKKHGRGDDSRFDRFWAAYPRKDAKKTARRAFDKIDPDEELLNAMLDAVSRQRASPQWQKDDGQYIPMPATWLNGERWKDQGGNGSATVVEINLDGDTWRPWDFRKGDPPWWKEKRYDSAGNIIIPDGWRRHGGELLVKAGIDQAG